MDGGNRRKERMIWKKSLQGTQEMEEKIKRFYMCSRLLYCRQLTQQRLNQQGAAGSTASSGCSTGTEEPACTKLMGNCSDWLLPSLEQGLEGAE